VQPSRAAPADLAARANRTPPRELGAAQDRLGNDPGTELGVVRAELAKIALLRLGKALTS
jgi:2-oxo-4-hydroxy-4-carboxy--5-ureidoimidazoline (OHCU) decarboxylase